MATSSSSNSSCFQCQESTKNCFQNGWKLRNGEHAHLCNRCGCVYEEGRFCETFHSSDDGWRDCESCGKLVHCGCVVSFNQYFLLDFGGVICRDCSKKNFILERNRRYAREFQTDPTNVQCNPSTPYCDSKEIRREVSEPKGMMMMNFLDLENKEWEFSFRFWPNSGSRTYVLEGIRDFLSSRKLQAGDTVSFYRVEPGAKLVIGFRKTSVAKPPHMAST